MECNRCNSGYPIALSDGEKFCRFCGSSVKAIRFAVKDGMGPFYIDEPGEKKILLSVKNVGVTDYQVGELKIY